MKNDEIVINQALHGYKQGHELLASSIDLPSSDKRKMLYLSDSSGSEFSEAFDGYLEGYPLSQDNYVLSRTWRATEMKRPGCVWTHSLIVSRNDFAKLDTLYSLFSFFKRPDSTEDFAQYKKKLTVCDTQFSQSQRESNFIDLAYAYVFSPEKQIIIPAKDKEQTEIYFLNFWTLLSADQKFSLSFCAGYFSLNQPPKESFQITFIPKSGKRFSWDKNTAIFLDADKKSLENESVLHSEEYKEIVFFSFIKNGLNKSSIDNASQLYQLINHTHVTDRMKLMPLLEGGKDYAIKIFGPEGLRFKAAKDIPELELLRVIISDRHLRHIEELDVLKRIKSLSPNDALNIFLESLRLSNDEDNRNFSIQLYDLIPTLQYAQIDRAPKWFVANLIVEEKPFNISTLWSLSHDEILSVLSYSLANNKSAVLEILENSMKVVRNKRIDLWLLQNIADDDFESVVSKFHINLEELSYPELKKIVSRFPLRILELVHLERIPEEIAIDLFMSTQKFKNGHLFLEKLNIIDSFKKLNWGESFWLKIVYSIAGYDSYISNRVFIRIYPHLLGFLSRRSKHSKWSDLIPFSHFFKSFEPVDDLRLILLKVFLSKRIPFADFLSFFGTKDEIYEFETIFSSLENHERRRLRSMLSEYSGTKQEEDKIHFLLKVIDK